MGLVADLPGLPLHGFHGSVQLPWYSQLCSVDLPVNSKQNDNQTQKNYKFLCARNFRKFREEVQELVFTVSFFVHTGWSMTSCKGQLTKTSAYEHKHRQNFLSLTAETISVLKDFSTRRRPGQSWSKRRLSKRKLCWYWGRGNCAMTTQQERTWSRNIVIYQNQSHTKISSFTGCEIHKLNKNIRDLERGAATQPNWEKMRNRSNACVSGWARKA